MLQTLMEGGMTTVEERDASWITTILLTYGDLFINMGRADYLRVRIRAFGLITARWLGQIESFDKVCPSYQTPDLFVCTGSVYTVRSVPGEAVDVTGRRLAALVMRTLVVGEETLVYNGDSEVSTCGIGVTHPGVVAGLCATVEGGGTDGDDLVISSARRILRGPMFGLLWRVAELFFGWEEIHCILNGTVIDHRAPLSVRYPLNLAAGVLLKLNFDLPHPMAKVGLQTAIMLPDCHLAAMVGHCFGINGAPTSVNVVQWVRPHFHQSVHEFELNLGTATLMVSENLTLMLSHMATKGNTTAVVSAINKGVRALLVSLQTGDSSEVFVCV
jgi:hypothetical protein